MAVVSKADLSYLSPLFELTSFLIDDDDPDRVTFGLAEADADSSLSRDNEGTEGYWVSIIVDQAITAALDHAIALRDLVSSGKITYSAPWTILRGVLEPAALAVWVLNGGTRQRRQERALRVWHHDYVERQKWEDEIGHVPVAPAKSGRVRAAEVITVARSLGLRGNQVAPRLGYADIVAHAGEAVGWKRGVAAGRWRESSGFAHGRYWPLMHLSHPMSAERIRGGFTVALTLGEEHHQELARLAAALLERAITDYAKAAAGVSAIS